MSYFVAPSDALIQESPDATNAGGTVAVPLNGTNNLTKQIGIGYAGTYRVAFAMRKTSGSTDCLGQIIRNRGGARTAIGAIRRSNSTTQEVHIEDIPGWEDGDVLELHAVDQTGTGSNASLSNLALYGTLVDTKRMIQVPAGVVLKASL
jgi:hypothetical protein